MENMTNNVPLFSICIPVYNTERYLRQCLDSILSQDFSDYEVIMVDDGSKDSSLTICEEYQNNDSRFFAIHQGNAGAVVARKTAVNSAKGKYVIVLDSDDYIANGLLKRLSLIIAKYDPSVIKLNYAWFSGGNISEVRNKFQDRFFASDEMETVRNSILYDSNMPGLNNGNIAYSLAMSVSKREVLISHQSIVPNEIRWGDDLAVTAPMIYEADSIYFTDTIDYYYRDTPGSLMHSFNVDELRRVSVLLHFLSERIPKENAINVYAANMVFEYAGKATQKYTIRKFRKHMREEITPSYLERMHNCNVHDSSVSELVKLFLLRNELFSLFYMVTKVKRIITHNG